MSQGLFYTSLRREIKRSTPVVHSGMERLLPSNGIDAIEKRHFGGNLDVLVCHSFDAGVAEKKYPREAKTILAGSMVQYFGGNKNKGSAWSPYLCHLSGGT